MKTKKRSRLMVIFLSFLVCMSLMPMTTFAEGNSAPVITNAGSLPFAVEGKPYEYTFTATAEGTVIWGKYGDWPSWLELDSSTGKIHGTPTSDLNVTTGIRAKFIGSDGVTRIDIKYFYFNVYKSSEIAAKQNHDFSSIDISGTNLPDAIQNSDYLGADDVTFYSKFNSGFPVMTIEGVPDGMKDFNGTNWIRLDGKPTQAGTYSIKVTLSTYADEERTELIETTEKTFTLKVNPEGSTPQEEVTVSFDNNGGSGSMADVTVNKGSNYTLPDCVFTAPDGKEFKAWEVGGVEKSVGDSIAVNANTTVKALWVTTPSAEIKHITAVSFSLTNFALNKSISSLQVASQTDGVVLKNIELLTYDSGEDEWIAAKGTLQANTRYRLKVVFKEKDGFDFEGPTKENITLQGIGTALKYGKINSTQEKTATFDLPIITAPVTPVAHDVIINSTTHGTVTADKTKAKKGETVTLTIKPDSGYVVDEISVMDDGASNVPVTDNKFTMPDMLVNVNVTFKAKPVTPVEKVTVTFDKNGGSGSMADATVNKGSSYKLPACEFTAPAGKEFKAWEVSGVEKAPNDSITVNADTKVKAIWKAKPVTPVEKVKVTFDNNGGSGSMADVTVNKDTNYTLPECGFTAPIGKEFDKWEVNGDPKSVGDSITVNADTTVKAIWKAKTVIVNTSVMTIKPDGGKWADGTTTPKTYTVEVGKYFTLPEAPIKDGYTFLYWQGSKYNPGEQYLVTELDHTFTAVWQKNEVKPDNKGNTSSVNTKKVDKTSPKTGDNGMMYVYALELLMAASGMLILNARRNKKSLK